MNQEADARPRGVGDARDLPTPALPGSGSKGFSQPYVRGAPLVHYAD